MATGDEKSVCPVCFNLDFDHIPQKEPPCVLDSHYFNIPFLKVKASSKSESCLPCSIICAGLECMQEQWEDSEDDQFLLEDTLLLINLRRGHSLRITCSNPGDEKILEFYTLSEKDNASIFAIGISRAVATELDLDRCLELAREWMKKCDTEHNLCGRPISSRLPTRVIDVGPDATSDTVYLRETTESNRDLYMSLSHCWGKEQIITTTTSTLLARKASINLSELSELSENFRDAVMIARYFGIRYLWIDSLCLYLDRH
ncbi:uncharacterized protein PAC_12573 [Phialocephala subalpina]|uniref:Heterokaryon incompatibility domain-containing protein n=1 Tax=Phialocephala subalpina TaxID=576137 RepID=A0A1L7XCF2_9HELO|nr:uncharacterized protein PAC_12573 [Phialocephala subalpina]